MPPEKKISAALVKNGHRLTQSRRLIIETLVALGGHVTADHLADQVRQEAPFVGRMTVYRTLDLLTELGLVRPIFQGTGAAHYVLMTAGSHHHLICSRCQRVIEFEDCGSSELLENLAAEFNFSIHSHLLEAHGLCSACQEAGPGL